MASSKVIQQSSGRDPVIVNASYISKDISDSAINISMQRKSGSVVGLIPNAGFSSQPYSSNYGHIQARVKTRMTNLGQSTKTYIEKRASVLEQKKKLNAKKLNEHK